MNSTCLDRFMAKILTHEETGCWLWCASLDKHGYGQFWDGRLNVNGNPVMTTAHRVSYRLFKHAIPAGYSVCHTCDVRHCVNPDHLFLGTHADNMRDMVCKNRSSRIQGEQHVRARLRKEQVLQIRERYAQGGVTQKALAEEFGISYQHVSDLVNYKKWAHLKSEV